MKLLDYLGTALSISAIMAIISYIMSYRNKGNEEKQKNYWRICCLFGGITIVVGIGALAAMRLD